jgi:CheY-like chemotaxis protein
MSFRLLVGEDSATMRRVIEIALAGQGLDLVFAREPEKVLGQAQAGVQGVLLDVTLPRMDGYELCRSLRSNPVTASLPVLLMTGPDGADAERIAQARAIGQVKKPFECQTLIAAVQRLRDGAAATPPALRQPLPRDATPPPRQATPLPRQATPLPRQATPPPRESSPPPVLSAAAEALERTMRQTLPRESPRALDTLQKSTAGDPLEPLLLENPRASIDAAAREIIERIAWEVVPALAEAMLRERIDEMLRDAET